MKPQGYFEIEIDNMIYTYKNTVVNSGKTMLLRLLSGEDVGIDSISVGESGADTDLNQTSLLAPIATKKVNNFVQGTTDIVFEATFHYNEGNGTIREIGVFGRDGTLFARRAVLPQPKDSTKTMRIRYKFGLED